MSESLESEVRDVLDLCGEALVMVTGNGGWTCAEADALHGLLRRVSLDHVAYAMLLAHAESDGDEGDLHAVGADGAVVWLSLCGECGTRADVDGYCVDPGCTRCGKAVTS